MKQDSPPTGQTDEAMSADNPINRIKIEPEPLASEKRAAVMGSVGLLAWLLAFRLPGWLTSLFKKLSHGILGKIAMGVLCTALWGAIKEAPAILRGIRWICSGIGQLGDDKATTTIKELLKKGGEVVKQQSEPDDEGKPKPTLKERFKGGVAKAKEATKEAVDDSMQKVEDKTKPLAQKAERAFDKLGSGEYPRPPAPPYVPPNTGGIGMGAIPQPIAPPQGFMGPVKKGVTKAGDFIHDYTSAQQKRWEDEAPMREEFARWWGEHGANASCPNTRCRLPMRLPASASKPRTCPKCNWEYSPRVARMNPPPPPRIPPTAFITHWKKKCEEQSQSSPSQPSTSPTSKSPTN
jgi:hypothetical protein